TEGSHKSPPSDSWLNIAREVQWVTFQQQALGLEYGLRVFSFTVLGHDVDSQLEAPSAIEEKSRNYPGQSTKVDLGPGQPPMASLPDQHILFSSALDHPG
ncbi:hypothetical protein STEG23_000873, partial [Scotinomys teguina]